MAGVGCPGARFKGQIIVAGGIKGLGGGIGHGLGQSPKADHLLNGTEHQIKFELGGVDIQCFCTIPEHSCLNEK